MSRCFPYPPPGYSGKCSSDEALILSIKLQEEKEKSKLDRKRDKSSKSSEKKKERKEKKEKKKEKKEKKRRESKSSSGVNKEKQNVIEKLYEADKCVEPNAKCSLQEDTTGQLERSSVTEEHGWPYVQNVSCSSDSTSNSSKRKRLSTPPSSIQNNGKVLRIRLSSSQKRDEPSTSGAKEQEISGNLQRRTDRPVASCNNSMLQPCPNVSSVKQRDIPVKAPQAVSHSASTSNAANQPVLKLDKAVVPSLPPVTKTESAVPKEKNERKEKLSSHEKKLKKKESKYNKLFEAWVPPPLESMLVVNDDENDDWLFSKKGEERTTKRMRTDNVESSSGDNNLLSCASYALQPRSIFLPDADIYALPYTVPF